MEELGIHLAIFAPIHKDLTKLSLNYRNHQKIVVVDTSIGYTGGINLSDEYFNIYPKYGHWKDTAVRLQGEAVASLAATFTAMWNYTVGSDMDARILSSAVGRCPGCALEEENGGFVQPFYGGPVKARHNNADMVYQSIMRHAKRYLWITTPYLVLDRAIADTLIRAAKSGVDVRIYTPRHYDKWYVYRVTESNYGKLLREGIRIFEYVPGFLHSKNLVTDDDCAICGSINLDYRSFYFHYEYATVFYGGSTVAGIKADMEATETICEEILLERWIKRPIYRKILGRILRCFSPLF
jgi:cardiolipin synthase